MEQLAALKIDDTVIVLCNNGALIAGPWKGTQMFQNEPIVTIGKRTEYFKSVRRIDKVTDTELVYDSES